MSRLAHWATRSGSSAVVFDMLPAHDDGVLLEEDDAGGREIALGVYNGRGSPRRVEVRDYRKGGAEVDPDGGNCCGFHGCSVG